MYQTIVSGIFVLLGVVLGWILNMCSENRFQKPKLCYQLQPTMNQDELLPLENRTKTSESGFEIVI